MPKNHSLPVFFILIVIIIFPVILFAQNKNIKKIIEFGWDYPKVSFLKSHIDSMQKTPFDGVVFSFDFDIYNAFDTTFHPESQFQYKDLSQIQWKNFTDNFLFVRGASYTGAHWLDDKSWGKIIQNLKKVSKAVSVSKAKGIGFDPEYYYNNPDLNPWIYKPSLYKNLTYQEVGAFVKKRGKQFIRALQTYKPDINILCFWLLGLVSMQNHSQPLEKIGMALYPFFVEGMLEGKNKSSVIIDGNEYSYGYDRSYSFVITGKFERDTGLKYINPSLHSNFRKISIAQAIYLDLIYAKLPVYNKGYDTLTKARWLRENLYNAFKTTDKYVWFYNERVNWWKGEVDSGVCKIIAEVKNQVYEEYNNEKPEISGYSVVQDFKKKTINDYKDFHYVYTSNNTTLHLQLLDTGINTIQVFSNSREIYHINNPKQSLTIDLNRKYNKKDNLIVLSMNSKGSVSVAYVN